MIKQILVLAVILASAALSMSTDSAVAMEALKMQALLNKDGSGFLGVNNPREPMTWEACSPALSDCTPFGSGRRLSTVGANPETIFRITSGDGSTGLSPVWHGNVASLTPPSVSGIVRANELVTPVPGQWDGGWEGEGDLLQLAACRTRRGTNCTTLTDEHYPGCRGSSAVLDPAFIGDYLRVADQRRGTGPHFMLRYRSRSPYGARGGVWEASPTTSAAVVGRIAAPSGSRRIWCGFPPLDHAWIFKSGIAKVECGLGCRAVLIAKRGWRRARVVRKPSRWQTFRDPMTLRLSRRSLAHLRLGRVQMIVKIDGRRVARRTVLLG
jgi:hypothetical protein